MVQGPPIILGLSDAPSESSGRSSRAASSVPFAEGNILAHATASVTALASCLSTTVGSPHSRSTTPVTFGRYGGYSGTTQNTIQQNNDDVSYVFHLDFYRYSISDVFNIYHLK